MIHVRKSEDRGHANHGWLDTYHTFSFADYYDSRFMGFRALRVINEDRVEAGAGFPTHPHRDMEIITYIIEGALQHRDSMGNGSVIRPGVVQRMSAGTGVLHSEFNPSKEDPAHLLQIWIKPEKQGLAPGYEEKTIPEEDKTEGFRLLVSPDGRQGSARIQQDVSLWEGLLTPGRPAAYPLKPGRHAWVQAVSGEGSLNGKDLRAGDGAAVSDERTLEFKVKTPSRLLLFDLA